MKKFSLLNKMLITLILTFVIGVAFATPTFAQLSTEDLGIAYAENLGLGNADPRDMAVSIVQVILGFLAILVVLLILYGGFLWMTAAGNEDKVSTGKKVITAGVIGLVIVLAAWGIARFVVEAIFNATTGA